MDDQAVQFLYRCKTDREFFFRTCLRIRVLKDGRWQLVPFVPRPEQVQILRYIEECEAANRPIRFIILKARQLGFSTLIQAIWYHYCCFNPYIRAQVVAHLQKSTNRIAQIGRIMNENLPAPLDKHLAGKPGGNGLYWKHESMLEAVTQGSTEAARGDTPSIVHFSELGRWDLLRSSSSAEDVLQATLSPIDDVAGTAVAIESTAGGASGSLFERFTDAIEFENAPGNIWKSFFFSWRGVDKYTYDCTEEQLEKHRSMLRAHNEGKMALAKALAMDLGYDQEWMNRTIKHELTCGEAMWASQTMRSKYRNDVKRFDQEFPLTWQLAFVTSGRPVFNQDVIAEWRSIAQPEDTEIGSCFIECDEREITLDPLGDEWKVYVQPVEGHEYIVATDSSSGDTGGDYSAIRVFDRHEKEFVASYYGHTPPDILGEQAVFAARKYNSAYIICEANNHGFATINSILGTGYRHLHRRNSGRAVRSGTSWVSIYGEYLDGKLRQLLVDMLSIAINNQTFREYDQRFIYECTTFIYDANGRADHMQGKNDDLIFASAYALYADQHLRAPRRPGEVTVEKNRGSRLSLKPNKRRQDGHMGRNF